MLAVPACNPGEIIIGAIERARRLADSIVIVDDGCDAETRAHLECCARHSGVSLLTHARNRGKGFALMTGTGHCLDRMQAGDCIRTMDSDGQHDPEDIDGLRALLAERRNVHFALGERLDTGATRFRAPTDSWRVLARLPYLAANAAARVVSATANFTGHKVFSFRSPGRALPKAARHVLAVAFALSVASVLLYVAVELPAIAGLIAKPLVDALVFLVNFAVPGRWVFGGRPARG